MPKKRVDNRDPNDKREDALRPCSYLGYDRDQLALHLMSREAYAIAATQFRRAVWLNPYEPAFKMHLAECLYHMHQCEEAREWTVKALEQDPDNSNGHRLLSMIDTRLAETPSTAGRDEQG